MLDNLSCSWIHERKFIIFVYIFFSSVLLCESCLEDTSDVEHLVETGIKKELILILLDFREWDFTADCLLLILVIHALRSEREQRITWT